MPITETTATATTGSTVGVVGLSAVTAAATTGSIDIAVLLGAFAGSVVFVMSAKEYHWLMRLCYLCVSTIIGYQSAPWTASILSLSSVVVAAIVNGVLAIILLNGLIEQAKSGKLLSSIISLLSNRK
jgi:hypothetical protein